MANWWEQFSSMSDKRASPKPWGSYEERQRGQGDRPWWISDREWRKRQREWGLDQALASAPNIEDFKAEWDAKWGSKLASLTAMVYDPITGEYKGPKFNPTAPISENAQYQGYQTGIAQLLERIKNGTTPEDSEAAFNQMAQLYGMTPEQFRAMQAQANAPRDVNALRENAYNMVKDSGVTKEFEAMIRDQQKSAMAEAGRQMENIFAERGGMGFDQAYEMTNQISDSFLKERTQFLVDQSYQAYNQLNADLDRQQARVQSGEITAQQFLNDRWGLVQTAFQDTTAAANQLLQEWMATDASNRANFEADLNSFVTQFNLNKDVMMTELGIDAAMYDSFAKYYDATIKPALEALIAAMG